MFAYYSRAPPPDRAHPFITLYVMDCPFGHTFGTNACRRCSRRLLPLMRVVPIYGRSTAINTYQSIEEKE